MQGFLISSDLPSRPLPDSAFSLLICGCSVFPAVSALLLLLSPPALFSDDQIIPDYFAARLSVLQAVHSLWHFPLISQSILWPLFVSAPVPVTDPDSLLIFLFVL